MVYFGWSSLAIPKRQVELGHDDLYTADETVRVPIVDDLDGFGALHLSMRESMSLGIGNPRLSFPPRNLLPAAWSQHHQDSEIQQYLMMMSKRLFTKWESIREEFTDSVLLGNGASIAIYERLHYKSLYSHAKDEEFLNAEQSAIFDQLRAEGDFEFVLRNLATASIINRCLKPGGDDHAAESYESVKSALIRTVKSIHPQHEDVVAHLQSVARFLKQFDTVFSLNYDLLVYWAMMVGNEECKYAFKDCFLGGVFNEEYEEMRSNCGTEKPSTLVFYPHGNLVLVSNLFGAVRKLKAGTNNLVNEIERGWKLGGNNPLFVAEGESTRKLLAIQRNHYLSAVLNELSGRKQSILVYGCSMGEQDNHILDALKAAAPKRVAVSVYAKEDNLEHYCSELRWRLSAKLEISDDCIDLVDSDDDGLWKNMKVDDDDPYSDYPV